jgi:hypothetical protein
LERLPSCIIIIVLCLWCLTMATMLSQLVYAKLIAMWVHIKTNSRNSGVVSYTVNSLMIVVATTETCRNMVWLYQNLELLSVCGAFVENLDNSLVCCSQAYFSNWTVTEWLKLFMWRGKVKISSHCNLSHLCCWIQEYGFFRW